VLVIESEEILLRGLASLMDELQDVEVVGTATTPGRAQFIVERAGRFPDVMVIGSDTFDRDELRAIRSVIRPEPSILVVMKTAERELLARAAVLGADGYVLLAGLTACRLADALRDTRFGRLPMPAPLARLLLGRANMDDHRMQGFLLTAREREVLTLLGDGLSNKEIARLLRISVHGAKHHVSNVLAKLHCPSRTAAVVAASRDGLLV